LSPTVNAALERFFSVVEDVGPKIRSRFSPEEWKALKTRQGPAVGAAVSKMNSLSLGERAILEDLMDQEAQE